MGRLFRPRTIRFRLASLIIVCVLPVWLFGCYLLYYSYKGRLTLTERHMQETARALMMVIDRELTSMQSCLEALATSPSLRSGDFATFHSQAQEVLKRYPESDIILADSTGQQLVNSFRPFGTPLPRRNSEAVRRTIETGKPGISDLFRGAVTGRPLIGVDVPVVHDGQVAYDLAMTAPADRLAAILLQQALPPEWVGTILDSTYAIVARTQEPELFVGKQVAKPLVLHEAEDGKGGISEGTNIKGVNFRAGFSRSDLSGWTVSVNMPTAVLLAELRQWVLLFSAMATTVLAAGLGIAYVVGRGVVGDVHKLSEGAKRIAGGDLSHGIAAEEVIEFADLSRTFNGMAESLSAARAGQKMYQDELEGLIEERTSRLRELSTTASLLNAIMEGTPELIAVLDDDYRLLSFNSAYAKEIKEIYGRGIEIGMSLEAWLMPDHPEDLGKAKELWGKALRGETFTVTDEYGDVQLIRKAYEFRFSPVRNEHGEIIGAEHIGYDITPRVKAEQTLRHMKKLLEDAERIAESGSWEWNLRTDKFTFSANWLRIHGVTTPCLSREVLMRLVHPDDAQIVQEALNEALAGLRPYDIMHRIVRPDTGEERIIHAKGDIVRDPKGEPLLIQGWAQDVTERKAAEDAVRRANRELEAANQELEAFSYSVSHDLRSPLRTIEGFSQIVLEKYGNSVDERGRDYLQRIRAAVIRMETLITDILRLSRLSRANMSLEQVDLSGLADTIVEGLRERDAERKVEVEIQPGMTVAGDRALLRAALENLIGNAWKFTAKQDGARIEIGAIPGGGEDVVFVRDNGAGFNSAYSDKLFRPFQRLHQERDFPGTGIGLAIVQRVARRHAGHVRGESGGPGQGATFYISLPKKDHANDRTEDPARRG